MNQYKSTRGSAETKTAAQAIIKGIAEDKGLFVPELFPKLSEKPEDFVSLDYREVAYRVLSKFLDDYTEEELRYCIDSAYDDKFEAEEVVPLKKGGEAYFLELYHGKTAAFKDMALSILPYLLTTAMKKEKEDNKIVILTATSGDTGKAALEGFADVSGTEIVVFYPSEGVSQVQERQMITQQGENTHVYAIRGNFDDAQTGVKKIFSDKAFSEELEKMGCKFSSANSINIGRLVPQVAYYVWAYVQLIKQGVLQAGEPMNVVVPTGNFGNILAGYYAKQMGIPIHKFLCASNENKVLTDFINTGIYDIQRDFHITNSPSMDILISSNLERLLYHLSGGNGAEIKELMENLEKNKKYEVSSTIKEGLADFYAGFATEEETKKAIGDLYAQDHYLMDTHTAVAYKVYEDYRKETGDNTPTVIVSTASAYKFADSVADAIGLPKFADGFAYINALNAKTGVRVPKGLTGLENKQVRHTGVVDKDALSEAVRESLK
ncbi:threonine synthase [Sinanaerobacter sp. ZZT-01]|uniref:threonine synthase n=1 Tax=Sinanaerobacter sp. ZZT-01 TaxID=3111540 RepID=UPI002D788617|nr:threonine synthase [Sinanaerobacter sp. ZZT-01]WRR94132.1 threonine synthase [Sinanaerobacter sp. ZZT-01]